MAIRCLLPFLATLALLLPPPSASAEPRSWEAIVDAAAGQTVHFNAWGGDDRVNEYIGWVGDRVDALYGIDLEHVKLSDTADAVSRVLAEKTAGRDTDGSIDLIWINGENFAAMKANGLLHGPWVDRAPNFAAVDVEGKPTTVVDFSVPTDGLEAPWGMAQFTVIYDTAYVETPPRDTAALLAWVRANPGRFTYPQPPDFIGTTFIKQILAMTIAEPDQLVVPLESEGAGSGPQAVTAPLWTYLDSLHPHLWRDGRAFPADEAALRRLLGDGEVSFALAFNPARASAAIEAGELPDTVRTFVFDGGTIGNTHFVAVPYNAAGKEAAMVVADFLMSPEAQLHKQDPRVWGDFTVLDIDALSPADRAAFAALPRGVATLSPAELGPVLPEPHPSWVGWLEAEWERRYARGR
ncbi:ABC transporter substrate-binding protein [Thalassobaculum sp.]|uniref:ABC transporter substrate-binding protein n=1 Tax=Thalassobaculum sp. TaxID=2022740 RepID=UPI0032EBB5DB